MNEHYEEHEWIEFLRDPEKNLLWEKLKHAESCGPCSERLAFARELSAAMDPESTAVLEDLVQRIVRGIASEKAITSSQHVFAGLTSDTLIKTQAGLRSLNLNERQLSFESDHFRIDITTGLSGRRLLNLVGNVTAKTGAAPGVTDVPIEILFGHSKLTGQTNNVGEFYFRIESELTGGPLELRFLFSGGPCLTALLPF